MATNSHPFHIVDQSPWPLFAAVATLAMTTGLISLFYKKIIELFFFGLFMFLLTVGQWWRDVTREGTLQGAHTIKVQKSLRYGMILFIASELLFFFGFFWAFFNASLTPSPETGECWPPTGIIPLDPFGVPLLNTTILLASGVSVTWAHHCMLEGDRKGTITALIITILLGVYFTTLQAIEYYEAKFTLADGIYGSTFFVATGFHGLHVIIGTSFLLVCLMRQTFFHFTTRHHFGFEAAAWYWHFVDVIWLFLFASIYWWGTCFLPVNCIYYLWLTPG